MCPRLLLIRSTIASSTLRLGCQGKAEGDPGMRLDRSTKLGRYEILEPIGAGGMGEAYKALDPHLHRSVTGRQALRRSSVAGWDKATHDPLTFLLNFFDPLQRRVPLGGQ